MQCLGSPLHYDVAQIEANAASKRTPGAQDANRTSEPVTWRVINRSSLGDAVANAVASAEHNSGEHPPPGVLQLRRLYLVQSRRWQHGSVTCEWEPDLSGFD